VGKSENKGGKKNMPGRGPQLTVGGAGPSLPSAALSEIWGKGEPGDSPEALDFRVWNSKGSLPGNRPQGGGTIKDLVSQGESPCVRFPVGLTGKINPGVVSFTNEILDNPNQKAVAFFFARMRNGGAGTASGHTKTPREKNEVFFSRVGENFRSLVQSAGGDGQEGIKKKPNWVIGGAGL